MRPLLRLLAFGLSAVAMAAAAQPQQDPELWRSPDVRDTDASGKLKWAFLKNRANYTARVFQEGHWFTYAYEPHTEKLLRVIATDSEETMLYDTAGSQEGISVKADGRTFTIRSNGDAFAVEGMPRVTAVRDASQRHTAFATDGAPLIGLLFAPNARLGKVSFGASGYSLVFSEAANDLVTETLRGPDGSVVKEVTARGIATNAAHRRALCLDAAADLFGLGNDWENSLQVETTTTGSLLRLKSKSGTVLGYVVSYGGDRFGFDAAGRALFYDLRLNLMDRNSIQPGSDAGRSMRDMSGVVPMRVVITRNGSYGVCAPTAMPNAFEAVWIETGGRGNVLRYRTFNPASAPRGRITPTSTPLKPVSNMLYVCGSSTTCMTCDYCASDGGPGTSCSTTDYLCDDTYNYGGGDTTGSGGSGGSGGGGGNQVAGDAALQLAVSRALSSAQTKLQDSGCRNLLSFFKDAVGNTLAHNLQIAPGGPWDPWQYMRYVDSYYNGYTNGPCSNSGNAAYTSVWSTEVYVGTQFSNLTASVAANRLIHEFFHTIGLPENPPSTTAYTSSQINSYIDEACGTN